ncbi:protein toll [Pogonomyrmex barbatus]|uniref:Protein toll n=1 Tax=Pogonomyrmex barbatus TaxID=144034 RepID=A0A6I9WK17_9HYME|nr:protein toll [Pogonomyrmex barbatus]
MITRKACFIILAIVLGNVSASHCPMNQNCICQPNHDGGIEINCSMKNESSFIVNIQPGQYLKIECINSPEWSDFHLDVSSLTKNDDIKSIYFRMCNLPTNSSLGEITRMLGIGTSVEKLSFQSYKNLSFTLVKHHLDDFENLKYLTLSSNNVTYVDKDLLAGLVNLTGLDLRENNLHLASGFFNYNPGLQWIELGDNDLQSIALGTFDNLKNLTFLNLWKNHLTTLQSGIFDKLVTLKTLDLNTNYLVTLPEDIFAKLKNLEVLNLSRNNFTHLPRNLLQNNTKLRVVTLLDNKQNMTTLPNGLFANLIELKVLNLKKNGLVTLPEDLFWGSSSLTNISLERNYLTTLPVHIFQDLNELQELKLNFNDLEKLPDYIFSDNKELITLDLSKNRLTSISKHLFQGLQKLQKLNMEQNQLIIIDDYGFSPLKQLKIAKLSNNYLTLQRTFDDYPNEYRTKSPFHDCESLEELYLANNSISEICSDWVMSTTQLRKLDLKYNNISIITTEDMQFISNNIKVDLTHNKIQHILLRDAEEIASYQAARHDAIILVEDNPLHCDCNLYDFLRYIEGRMHPKVQNYFHIIPGHLTCQTPENLKNVRVKDLRSELLTCLIMDPDVCPENCNCFLRPEDKTFIYDFSHKKLTSVNLPSNIKKLDNSLQVELNFSDNQLTQMPNLKTLGFESVKKLILSHNNISEISLDGLSNTLQVLELNNNNLTRIQPDVLEFLKQSTNLTRLALYENPWECDCEAKDFLNFIQTKFVTISGLLEVMCSGKNNSITEMSVIDFCPFNTTAIISVSVAISLMGLFIGIFGLLYYKYQRQIKVWLFAHKWCLWFVTEEELDKDKLYDAFVSYSHKDHDFVVNELVPKLEKGPTPFKLCLHYRDWLAGEWIPANIARSVEDSRRTIVVLSPNFMESVWGRMEFRAAHSQALSEGRARVILILYGDVGPTDDLDPELKAYISMNTYVKWGDPWFWDKLRYALPHQTKFPRDSIAGKKIFENHQLCIQTNGDKKELIYPIGLPETPPNTTPPAETLKKFICDKEEQLFLNEYTPNEACKLNENIAIILTPEHLIKHSNGDCVV